MYKFKATLDIIGINPFVYVPEKILEDIFAKAGKDRGHIPVCVVINNNEHKQTLVKFIGHWRLYINTSMLKNSPKRIGEIIDVAIEFDPADRTIKPHPEFLKALDQNIEAKQVFESLSVSRQKEIIRYISFLKSAESVTKNIQRVLGFLTGKNRFVGRDKP
ncbi:MAG: YdeI/OmpD-associated family protein [bacterium]|nr:YdeI/OmpD-associated family protein [bacterium]